MDTSKENKTVGGDKGKAPAPSQTTAKGPTTGTPSAAPPASTAGTTPPVGHGRDIQPGAPTQPGGTASHRQKDTRRILSAVQIPTNHVRNLQTGGMVATSFDTFKEGDEDGLEAVMTPKQYERLKKLGAIDGDWEPKGQEPTQPAFIQGQTTPTPTPPAGKP